MMSEDRINTFVTCAADFHDSKIYTLKLWCVWKIEKQKYLWYLNVKLEADEASMPRLHVRYHLKENKRKWNSVLLLFFHFDILYFKQSTEKIMGWRPSRVYLASPLMTADGYQHRTSCMENQEWMDNDKIKKSLWISVNTKGSSIVVRFFIFQPYWLLKWILSCQISIYDNPAKQTSNITVTSCFIEAGLYIRWRKVTFLLYFLKTFSHNICTCLSVSFIHTMVKLAFQITAKKDAGYPCRMWTKSPTVMLCCSNCS